LPSNRGLVEGIIHLAEFSNQRLPISPQRGIILLARATMSEAQFREFLQHHGFPGQFTKVGLVVCDFGDKLDASEKSEEFARLIVEMKGKGSLIGGAGFCENLLAASNDDEAHSCMFRLLSQIHPIVRDDHGEMVQWSIISTGIPAALRHDFIRYAGCASIAICEPRPGFASGKGTRGSIIHFSGKDILDHRVMHPSPASLRKVKEMLRDKRKHVKEVLATCALAHDQGISPVPYKEKDGVDLVTLNREFFPAGHKLRDLGEPKLIKRDGRKHLKGLWAIVDRDDAFQLTREGLVGGRIVLLSNK